MNEILRDIGRILDGVPERQTAQFTRAILEAQRVFMFGLGRSGLAARMFGMRLVHLGRSATIVGDTTTPAIRAGDLLVECSRTGLSPILHHAVNLAHAEGARVVALTGEPDTPLERDADCVIRLPLELATASTVQPMGSLFEQVLHIYLDGVVLRLMRELNWTPEDMERIHSNLP